MEISVLERGRAVVVALEGDLDWIAVPSLEAELARARQLGGELMILDLSGVEFMDSSGVQSLVTAHRQAGAEGRRLEIIESSKVRKLLRRYGLEELFTLVAAAGELPSPTVERSADSPT